MFIMAKEPFPNMSPSDVKAYFSDKQTKNDLANAYAIASNKFCWVEDNEYDYADGSPEHIAACAVTDKWGALMKEYENRIFEILSCEGIIIPETKQIEVLAPFMARFGYINGNGWWLKEITKAR